MKGIALIMTSKKPMSQTQNPQEPSNDLEARLDDIQTRRFGVPMDNLVMGGDPRAAQRVLELEKLGKGNGQGQHVRRRNKSR
jgi:hypothetical protein